MPRAQSHRVHKRRGPLATTSVINGTKGDACQMQLEFYGSSFSTSSDFV